MHLRNQRLSTRKKARAAFTLMELLVVVAILVVLVGAATPLYMKYLEQSKIKIARTDTIRLAGELKNFYVSNGDYPPENTWDRLPLEKAPLDPWNLQYHWSLTALPQADGTSLMIPVVWSDGPNKQDEHGNGDDIHNQ